MSYLESLMSTDETIQRTARQHWITILGPLTVNGLVLAASVALGAWAFRTGTFGPESQARPILAIGLGLVQVWALASLLFAVARWRAKQYLVTTRRVIEVDGILNKTVTDSNLDKVNDIVLRQSALGRVLGYGQIEIITGSDLGLNRFENIHDPLGFKRVMLDNKEDLDSLLRQHVDSAAALGPADVPAAIERLGALRDQGLITVDEFERKKAELLSRF